MQTRTAFAHFAADGRLLIVVEVFVCDHIIVELIEKLGNAVRFIRNILDVRFELGVVALFAHIQNICQIFGGNEAAHFYDIILRDISLANFQREARLLC